MQKTCTTCKKRQRVANFQKNGRGGYRPNCKQCIKAERSAARPSDITDLENPIFQQLTEKYGAHCNIGWSKQGSVLQVFTEPRLTWKGKTPEEVVGKALA